MCKGGILEILIELDKLILNNFKRNPSVVKVRNKIFLTCKLYKTERYVFTPLRSINWNTEDYFKILKREDNKSTWTIEIGSYEKFFS